MRWPNLQHALRNASRTRRQGGEVRGSRRHALSQISMAAIVSTRVEDPETGCEGLLKHCGPGPGVATGTWVSARSSRGRES